MPVEKNLQISGMPDRVQNGNFWGKFVNFNILEFSSLDFDSHLFLVSARDLTTEGTKAACSFSLTLTSPHKVFIINTWSKRTLLIIHGREKNKLASLKTLPTYFTNKGKVKT